MNSFLPRALFFLTIVAAFNACKHEPPRPPIVIDDLQDPGDSARPCSPDTVYFERDVLPVLISNCAMNGCHDPQSKQDGIILNNFDNVIRTGDVRPGQPNESDLYEVLVEDKEDKRMPPPPASRLNNAQIELIRKWIAQGAKNLKCGDCDSTLFSYALHIKPIIDNNCLGCHNDPAPAMNINLSTHAGVKAIADNGKLYGSVAQLQGYSAMPKGSKLSDCSIVKIKKWIDAGAPNN